jgi:DNA-binding GntR family transcriptional regulator
MTFLFAYWRWILALGLVALVAGAGWYVQSLRSENRELTLTNERMSARLVSYDSALRANQAALTARESEARALTQEKNEIIANLRKLYEDNEDACVWGDARIPDAIFDQLRGKEPGR